MLKDVKYLEEMWDDNGNDIQFLLQGYGGHNLQKKKKR